MTRHRGNSVDRIADSRALHCSHGESGHRKPPEGYRRGIALVWTAIFLLVLIGIVGLSLDWGKGAINVHQLQNAADAAALAGAQFAKFDIDGARWHARAISAENYADNVSVFLRDNPDNEPNLDVVVGYWMRQTRTFTAYDPANPGPTNAVKVVDHRTEEVPDGPLPLVFGSVFGKPTVRASRRAIAWSVGSTGAGLICLATDDTGLRVQGDAVIDVENGDVQIDSNSVTAGVSIGGTFTLKADEVNVVGQVDPCDRWMEAGIAGEFSVNTAPDVSRVGDPLENLPAPDVGAMRLDANEISVNGESVTLRPGYYPNGIRMTSGGIHLEPGIYAVGGASKLNPEAGLILTGGKVDGVGVMFYITKSLTGINARLNIGGNAIFDVNAPTEGPYEGISFFQDRANTRDALIIGTADSFQVDGVLYFPKCGDSARGVGLEVGGVGLDLGVQLITWKLYVRGNANVTINYDGENFIRGYRSILVE